MTSALLLWLCLGPYVSDIYGAADTPACVNTYIPTFVAASDQLQCTNPASINVGTATALAADPADCSAGQATVGINASGTAQGCFTPGDVTAVGAGCATGACWTNGLVTSGTTWAVWEGTSDDANQITWTIAADPAAAYAIAWPSETGTVCTTGAVCTGYQAGPLTGDVTTSGAAATIAANAVALTTDTTGNYAAGDAEAGAALTGDSATDFFSAGTIAAARLPEADDDGSTKGIVAFADADFDVASGVASLNADPASLGAITPTSIDAGTGAIQTGGDTEVWYDASGCYLTGWVLSFSAGHWTVGSSPGSGAQFSCPLDVPKTLLGATVTVRSVLVYFAVTASSAFDELTLYVQDVTAGTFTDLQRQTTDQTSSPYTFTGTPRAMGAGEALVVSGAITITFDAFTFRGIKVIYDTD